MKSKQKVGTIALAFMIIDLASRPDGATMKEITTITGCSRVTAYNVSNVLEGLGKISSGMRAGSLVRVVYLEE